MPQPLTADTIRPLPVRAALVPSGDGRLSVRTANNGTSETSAATSLTSLPASWSTGSTGSNAPLAAYGVGVSGDTSAPAAPTNLTVTSSSQTSVSLGWTAS